MQDREDMIIINNFIENDPLSENNLDKTLDLVDKFRLSCQQKSIWIYTGYSWERLMKYEYGEKYIHNVNIDALRQAIIFQCDVLVDGHYIDSLRDVTLHWRGSSNQRVINVKESLQKGEVVLWQT